MKHIPSKTNRSVSSIPWITPEIRRKIRRKNKTHAKAKKTGSSKLRSKFETLRREIKADVRKQHDLYVNNLVGDVKANPRDFYRYINSQKKDTQGIPPLKRKNGKGVAQSDLEKAEEFNGQFTDVFSKNEHTQVPLLDRSAPFMNDIAVSKDGVFKLLKGLNPSKALGPDELHPRVLKELATELGPVFAHLFQQSIGTGEIPKLTIEFLCLFEIRLSNTTIGLTHITGEILYFLIELQLVIVQIRCTLLCQVCSSDIFPVDLALLCSTEQFLVRISMIAVQIICKLLIRKTTPEDQSKKK